MASGFRHNHLAAIAAVGLLTASVLIAALAWQEWRNFPKLPLTSINSLLTNHSARLYIEPAVETVTGEVWGVMRMG